MTADYRWQCGTEGKMFVARLYRNASVGAVPSEEIARFETPKNRRDKSGRLLYYHTLLFLRWCKTESEKSLDDLWKHLAATPGLESNDRIAFGMLLRSAKQFGAYADNKQFHEEEEIVFCHRRMTPIILNDRLKDH